MSANIQIKWNSKKFPIEFPSVKDLETTSVKDLKTHIQRMTGADPSTMRLQAFGAYMTNDDMPLSIYGIRPGCHINLKIKENHKKDHPPPLPAKHHTSHEHKKHHHKQAHEPKEEVHRELVQDIEEKELIEKLKVVKSKVDTEIAPQVKKYEKEVKEFLNKSEKTEKEKKNYIYKAAYLGEQLMLILFALDAFSCGIHINARQKRKELVQISQTLLDKTDEIKSIVKNIVITKE